MNARPRYESIVIDITRPPVLRRQRPIDRSLVVASDGAHVHLTLARGLCEMTETLDALQLERLICALQVAAVRVGCHVIEAEEAAERSSP
jgi:hypothetical protein